MPHTFSQEEIDALLEVRPLSEAAPEADRPTPAPAAQGRVRAYDFKRPRFFNRAQLHLLGRVHEAFARDLSIYLSAQIRTLIEVNTEAAEQVLFSEFLQGSTAPTAVYVLDVQGLNQKMFLEVDPRLIIFIVERLFGGSGRLLDRPRALSPIERRIMSRVMESTLQELHKAWEPVFSLRAKEASVEPDTESAGLILPEAEPVLLVRLAAVVHEQQTALRLCYPYRLLERMVGTSGPQPPPEAASPESRQAYEKALRTTQVELRAELGRTHLPVSEVMQLGIGDVIPLGRRVDDPVQVYVEGREKFTASIGKTRERRALRILKVVENTITHDSAA